MDNFPPSSKASLKDYLSALLGVVDGLRELQHREERALALRDQGLRPPISGWSWRQYAAIGLVLIGGLPILAQALAPSSGASDGAYSGLTIVGLVLTAVVIWWRRRWEKRRAVLVEDENRIIRVENESLAAGELQKISEERQILARKFKDVGGENFPKTYLNRDALTFMGRALDDLRADSLPELINLYEGERHQRRVVGLLEDQAAEQERLTEATKVHAVVNAAGHAATVKAVRRQGAMTRAVIRRH